MRGMYATVNYAVEVPVGIFENPGVHLFPGFEVIRDALGLADVQDFPAEVFAFRDHFLDFFGRRKVFAPVGFRLNSFLFALHLFRLGEPKKLFA